MVVLPQPGGPQRISDASDPRSSIRVSVPSRAEQMVLTHHLVERAWPEPVGQRAGANCGLRSGLW